MPNGRTKGIAPVSVLREPRLGVLRDAGGPRPRQLPLSHREERCGVSAGGYRSGTVRGLRAREQPCLRRVASYLRRGIRKPAPLFGRLSRRTHRTSPGNSYGDTISPARRWSRSAAATAIFCGFSVFAGNNRGVGFDPSYSGPADTNGRIRIVRDYYSEKHAGLRANFIYSRHTLEHVSNPMDLLGPVRRSIGDGENTPVFIEVPNGSRILDECFFGTSSTNTRRTSRAARWRRRSWPPVSASWTSREAFHGQFLTGYARPREGGRLDGEAGNREESRSRDEQSVARFVAGYGDTLDRWRLRLDKLRESGRKTVIWGAGSKGITFLNSFDTRSVVDSVVDINPRKEGMYIAGTGHRIVSPERAPGDAARRGSRREPRVPRRSGRHAAGPRSAAGHRDALTAARSAHGALDVPEKRDVDSGPRGEAR